MEKYINVRNETGKKFYQDYNDKGKVVMLNLLKFKPKADYTNLDALKPEHEITGKQAYRIYMQATLPILDKAGGRLIFYGKCKEFLIGPEHENWDAVLLVEHQSATKFIAFAQDEDYLKIAGHRTAALEDSRLLPINENKTRT